MYGSSHACPQIANLLATYGLNLSTSIIPKTTVAQIRAMVEKSPERINAMTTNATKNIAAVPKSPISASAPIHTPENPIKYARFLLVSRISSVAAPINTNAIFTSSEGCSDTPPMDIQFFAPFLVCPNIILNISSPTVAIIT